MKNKDKIPLKEAAKSFVGPFEWSADYFFDKGIRIGAIVPVHLCCSDSVSRFSEPLSSWLEDGDLDDVFAKFFNTKETPTDDDYADLFQRIKGYVVKVEYVVYDFSHSELRRDADGHINVGTYRSGWGYSTWRHFWVEDLSELQPLVKADFIEHVKYCLKKAEKETKKTVKTKK